jgi:hypothetical protein
MKNDQPLFLIPSADPIVQAWQNNFQKLAQSHDQVVFTVNPAIVNDEEVAWIQQMVMALQHYPHLIERMIFSVKFKFMLVDDVPVELSEDEWKQKPEVCRWFYAMSSLPFVVYFIEDQDARNCCLMGDIMLSGKVASEPEADGKHAMIQFNEEQSHLLEDRLFHSAWSMFMYCHARNFAPDKYIDALLADYDMPFDAAKVRKKYEKDVEGGILFRMVPTT